MASFNWPPQQFTNGTVTSVGLADGSSTPIFTVSGSPVTGSGTLTFTLSNRNANTVLAGPTTGVAAQPSFRALVNADIPTALSGKTIPGTTNTLSSPLVGLVAGIAPAAGQVGQQMISSVTTNTNTAATATYFDARSIDFTAGTWDIQGCIQYAAAGATLTGGSEAGIGTVTGNSNTGEIDTVNWSNMTANPNTSENQTVLTPIWRTTISITTTYFLKGLINFSLGQPQYKATLRGIRVF